MTSSLLNKALSLNSDSNLLIKQKECILIEIFPSCPLNRSIFHDYVIVKSINVLQPTRVSCKEKLIYMLKNSQFTEHDNEKPVLRNLLLA